MTKNNVFPVCSDEARILKAKVFDFSESAAKQALWGIIQIFTLKTSITMAQFKEMLNDASIYSQSKKQP